MGQVSKSIGTVVLAAGLAAGLVALGHAWGAQDERLKHQLAVANGRVTASEGARSAERSAGDQVAKNSAATETRLDGVRIVTKTLIEKVPVHVPQTGTVSDRIPVGLARVHDAAAAGDVRLLSSGAGEPDEAASAFTKTDLAFAIAWNYGQAHECAIQLTAFQEHETARLAFEAEQNKKVEGGRMIAFPEGH